MCVWVGGESLPRCVPGESRQSATRSQDAAASKRRLPPSSPLLFLCASVRGPFEPTRAADTAPCPRRLPQINKSLIEDECGLAQAGGSFAKDSSIVAVSVCLKSLVSVKKTPIIPGLSWDFPALTDVRGLGYTLYCTRCIYVQMLYICLTFRMLSLSHLCVGCLFFFFLSVAPDTDPALQKDRVFFADLSSSVKKA